MGCRIGDPSKKDPHDELVYPFDPGAVKEAVECYAMQRTDPQAEPVECDWEKAAWNQVTGVVLNHIGNRFLDDLLLADRQKGQILSSDVTRMITELVVAKTEAFGVFLTDLQVFIDPPDLVKEQHIRHWGAERQSIATLIDGQAKAFNIRAVEKARAEAQRDLIIAIADGLKKNQSEPYTEPLLLSLSNVLDESLKDPHTRAHLAKETLETLDKLHEILDSPSSQVKYEG